MTKFEHPALALISEEDTQAHTEAVQLAHKMRYEGNVYTIFSDGSSTFDKAFLKEREHYEVKQSLELIGDPKKETSNSESPSTGSYTIKKGDSMYAIAKEFGVAPKDIQKFIKAVDEASLPDAVRKNGNLIVAGSHLVIPEEFVPAADLPNKIPDVSAQELF